MIASNHNSQIYTEYIEQKKQTKDIIKKTLFLTTIVILDVPKSQVIILASVKNRSLNGQIILILCQFLRVCTHKNTVTTTCSKLLDLISNEGQII